MDNSSSTVSTLCRIKVSLQNNFCSEYNVCHPPAIAKDKVCESSPIDLNIVAFGQWNLAKSGGKERCLKWMDHPHIPNFDSILILILILTLISILVLIVILF